MKDYKKILEGVMNIINTTEKSDIGFVNICSYIGENCPELEESEDEKIRKELIEFVKSRGGFKQEYIAWLEKQGEQKHVVIPKFRIGDIIRWKKADSVEYTIKEINDKGYINTADGIMDISQTDIEFELVEQKPAEPEKDEESGFMEKVNRIVDFLKNDPYEQKLTEEIDSWFVDKDKEQQKHAWSEEDESLCRQIESILSVCRIKRLLSFDLYKKMLDLLKSLKDRVQPQPKQEWSEEDNSMLISIENILIGRGHSFHDKEINWLKSLRPQTQWNPSDEQMKALNEVLNFAANHENPHWNDYIFGTLNNLIRQLKKLRGE